MLPMHYIQFLGGSETFALFRLVSFSGLLFSPRVIYRYNILSYRMKNELNGDYIFSAIDSEKFSGNHQRIDL